MQSSRCQIGSRLGPYEITAAIGAGGMGEVYRARDTRLNRDVALKVLPASLAADPERVWRFEQEARAAAAISHPNITAVHDVGRDADVCFIVSELLEGETLRTRLQSGPIAARKAVEIAVQIAQGLAAAHDRGVVHRDLKPENVFLTAGGEVKILDFGLAKLSERDNALLTSTALPTGIQATAQGVVLGTVGYMAPEQVRGELADNRADLFAGGVLLYEMLTGTRAFDRPTAVETMTAILNDEPISLTTLAKDLSPGVAQIVAHCIAKRPRDRFQSARDLAFALQAVVSVSQGVADEPRAARGVYRGWVVTAIAGIILIVAGVAIDRAMATRSSNAAARLLPASFSQLTTQPGEERSVRVSPDGRSFAYVSDSAGSADIFVQRIGGHNPLNLTSDSPARDAEPAFSPDGNLIAFRSERNGGGIFLMGATGESVRRLTDFGFAADWAPDGRRIVVSAETVLDPYYREASDTDPGLWLVDVPGGSRKQLLRGHAVQPRWSPDGRWIAFWGAHGARFGEPGQSRDLWITSTEGAVFRITDDAALDCAPAWSSDSRALYFISDRGGTLNVWRVAIDPVSGRRTDDAQPITVPAQWVDTLDVARDGRIVFGSFDERWSLWRARFDPERGRVVTAPEPIMRASLRLDHTDVSPDGEWVTFTTHGVDQDLFVIGSDGTAFRRLTDEPFKVRDPMWSPDGQWIAFRSNRTGSDELWAIRPDGSGLRQLSSTGSATGSSPMFPLWAPDGDRIVTQGREQAAMFDLTRPLPDRMTTLPPLGDGRMFLPSSWSPDGRALAGSASRLDLNSAQGVFIYSFETQAFREVRGQGAEPLWLNDGHQLLLRDQPAQPQRGSAMTLWILDLRTGATRSAAPDHVTVSTWRNVSLSRDNRTIVFADRTREGDIWLMTLK